MAILSSDPFCPSLFLVALKLDRTEDLIRSLAARYLLMKLEYNTPMHATLMFYGLRPSDDHILPSRIEFVPNYNFGPAIRGRPCHPNRRIVGTNFVDDNVPLMH